MLKPCPFCGTTPYLDRRPMWRMANGGVVHGYYECYAYDVHCPNPTCGCRVNLPNSNTIYNTHEEAKQNAINAWNRRFEEVK